MPHKHTHALLTSLTLLITLLTPLTSASEENGVAGLSLQAIPNAVSLAWTAPQGISVVTYYVHYSADTITTSDRDTVFSLDTAGDIPSFILKDLSDRGFTSGDTIHIAVTAVDTNDRETPLTEEKIAIIIVPASGMHAVGDANLRLLNAIALSSTQIKLEFSKDVQLPTEAQTHFTVTQDGTTDNIAVTQADADGRIVTLTTLPMTPLKRYTVTAAPAITGINSEPLDEEKNSAVFIGRGNPVDAISGPASSSVSSVPNSSSLSSYSSVAGNEPAPSGIVDSSSSFSSVSSSVSSSISSSSSSSSSSSPVSSVSSSSSQPQPQPDTTPPEDATNLILAKILQPDGLYTVKINWQASADTHNDLKNYNLFESKNHGISYKGPTAIAAVAVSATLTDVPPGTLTVKLTAQDRTGNESQGTEETIILPETGAISMLVMSLAGAGMWAGFGRRKKLAMRRVFYS